ncbi:MAG: glycosyltransferase family 1 protein [bacterium]|nr:glycosyltransferase family 1 protein [bacterium]
MRIAIQASDLDNQRIDGTRVYLLNMLNRFGKICPNDDFFVYHKRDFNFELTPTEFPNYQFISKNFPIYWTQTRFAVELWKGDYDALWMPMQALPFVRRRKLKTTVTIHDLAFKYFPNLFLQKDLRRLNLLTDFAIKHCDKIIAVSHSTKSDILKLYPQAREEKIKVIHHGFDEKLFGENYSEEAVDTILSKFQISAIGGSAYGGQNTKYILYVGALQPRKNLEVLIEAFDKIKNLSRSNLDRSELKLVLAGGKGWLWGDIIKRIEKSPYRNDIILTGTISFEDLVILYKNAAMFVFPSLYEGFGMPILEAFASKVPVISAKNSSLTEIGGDAALYFNEKDSNDLALKMQTILEDEDLKNELIKKGEKRLQNFSWDKCAKETMEFIKS